MLIDERVQPLAVAHWNFKRSLVGHNHQHLAQAVVKNRAAMAHSQMRLDLGSQSGIDVPDQ